MANALYPKWKEALITGAADSDLDTPGSGGVYLALIDTGTVSYNSSHQFYSQIAAGVVGTPVELTSKTYTNGVFDADDVSFADVTGNSAESIVIYIANSGANTTWRLVAWIDSGVTGLPVTPNSGDIDVTFNASGIFAI